ncbi:MAG TPA: HlyD family efflux transporter periplasmic adaptor subunit, partial [Dehalococcoidia bacterium]|nr:HlyD family efflux transporter periplasmic adaptor subunit [Dehalococcoidia bacterium]
GDTVIAGQRIATLLDPREIWVVANIDQEEIERIRPGQLVEVEVNYLDRKLAGRVEMVSPVTGDTSSLLPERGSSSNTRKVGPVVPVRISLDMIDRSLIPGSSANIKIRIRQPEED